MMTEIKWTYDEMYKWYTKQHKISDAMLPDVKAIIYESKRPSKKDSNVLEPFIKKNIVWTGLAPLQDNSLFPSNLFLVYDDNKNNKQSLYFVFPKEKEVSQGTKFLAADHYTFLNDSSDKRRPCHFHATRYVYDSGQFFAGHFKDFMSNKLVLPRDEADIFKKHQREKPFLLKLISLQWNQIQQISSGGTKTRYRPEEKAEYIKNNKAFCNKWLEEKVKKAVVFGIRRGNQICWTATIYKEGRLREAYGYTGIYYETQISTQDKDYETQFQQRFLTDFVSNV